MRLKGFISTRIDDAKEGSRPRLPPGLCLRSYWQTLSGRAKEIPLQFGHGEQALGRLGGVPRFG